MEQLVQNATKFIKEIFQNDFSGHDFFTPCVFTEPQ